MDQERASEVLRRFGSAITTVAVSVSESFPALAEPEDVAQEASILIMSYAGLVPGGRHSGALRIAERDAEGNEARVRRIITTKLRLDLSQQYGREVEKMMPAASIDAMPESRHPVVNDFADNVSGDISASEYPFLYAHYHDGMTGAEIAEAAGIARSTVTRRIAAEKREFVVKYVRRAGLVVEGDESTEELVEAYGHLKAAGR